MSQQRLSGSLTSLLSIHPVVFLHDVESEFASAVEGLELDPASAADPLTKSVRFRQVSILKRKTADATAIKRAHFRACLMDWPA